MKKISVRDDLKKNKNNAAISSALVCLRAKEAIKEAVSSVGIDDFDVVSYRDGVVKVRAINTFVAHEIILKKESICALVEKKTKHKITKIVFW